MRALCGELYTLGIRSLMVEGGARVIESFLQAGVTKSLIITVCPILVGTEGIGYQLKEVLNVTLF